MKYLFKIPDSEGGFFYKSIENNEVVTRDNERVVCDVQPLNIVERGMQLRDGEVIEVTDNFTVLKKSNRIKLLKKSAVNKKIIQRGNLEYELPNEHTVTGTFDTPSGKVHCECQPAIVRKALTGPIKIYHTKGTDFYFSTAGKNDLVVEVCKPILGTHYVKSIHCVKQNRGQKSFVYKAFGTKIKTPNIKEIKPKESLNVEGEQRPNHKYIERKLNPKRTSLKDKYIYLYEYPTGKRIWRDAKGKEIKGVEEATQTTLNLAFKPGTQVIHRNRIATVKDASDNFIWIEHEDKRIYQINKNDYLNQLKQQSSLKIGDTISLKDGGMATVQHIGENVMLVKKSDGTYDFVRRLQPIVEYNPGYDKGKGLRLPRINGREISASQTVLQGYNELDDFLINNYKYEDEPEYKAFVSSSMEGGYGKENDLRYSKYVKAGRITHKLSRFFDPRTGTVDIQFDGVTDYKISYRGKEYLVRDMNEEGYAVEDDDGDLFFITHDEISKELDKEAADVIMRLPDGNVLISGPKKHYRFSGELTEEQKRRIEELKPKQRRSTSKRLMELKDKERKQKEIEEQQAQIHEKIKQILQSQEYINASAEIKRQGFDITDNKFKAQKKVKVGDLEFSFTADYNKETNKFEPSLYKGKYEHVSIGGRKYDIINITEYEGDQFVTYRDNDGKEQTISIESLKKINGRRIFEPTEQAKGIMSTHQPSLVYFTPKVKELALWEVVELKDLVLSHHLDGSFNDKYEIKEAQNRDRSSEQSKMQVAQIANDVGENFATFAPDFSHTVDYGSPVVDKDYQVIAGNGRGLGIAQSYENGDTYKQRLIEHAEELGFNKEDIEKMRQPVIVRKLAVEDKKRIYELGILSNTEQKLAQTRAESGKGKSVLIDDKLFSRIADMFSSANAKLPEGGTIKEYLDIIGPDIVSEMVRRGVIQENEVPNYYDLKTKKLLPEQKEKIKDIIVQRLFGENGEHIDYLADSTQKGITDAIGDLMSLKGGKGDISQPLGEALRILRMYNNQKDRYKGNIKLFILQEANNQFDPLKARPEVLALFETFVNATPREIRNRIRKYKSDLEGDMFSEGKSPDEAFKDNFTTQFPNGIGIEKGIFARLLKAIR